MSIYKLNPLRKKKLIEILKTLYPEWNKIRIKRNGFIIYKKYTNFGIIQIFPKKEKYHISEICIHHLPKRLSLYRQGNTNYTPIYNEWLEYIINNQLQNIVDYLYMEFCKIKTTDRSSIILENSVLSLPDRKNNNTIGNIVKEIIRNYSIDLNQNFNKTIKIIKLLEKESIKDIYERGIFLISSNKI